MGSKRENLLSKQSVIIGWRVAFEENFTKNVSQNAGNGTPQVLQVASNHPLFWDVLEIYTSKNGPLVQLHSICMLKGAMFILAILLFLVQCGAANLATPIQVTLIFKKSI